MYVAALHFTVVVLTAIFSYTQRNSLNAYKKEIVVIVTGALSLLIFDLSER